MTVSSDVNSRRKAGITGIHTAIMRIPCMAEKSSPWVAVRLALLLLPAPRLNAINALIPMPYPMDTALMKF